MEVLSPNTVLQIPIIDLVDPSSDDLGHLFPFGNHTVLVVLFRSNRDLNILAEYVGQVVPPAGTNDQQAFVVAVVNDRKKCVIQAISSSFFAMPAPGLQLKARYLMLV